MGSPHVVSAARDFAARAHGAQLYGGLPFASHLDEVAVAVRELGDVHQTVAYLHHVLEGTTTTLEQVEATFGRLVAGCVGLLTDPAATDRKERSRLAYGKLAPIAADDERAIALVIETADRLVDVQTCYLDEERGQLRKYRRDYREFRAAGFRPGLADELWRELNELIGL